MAPINTAEFRYRRALAKVESNQWRSSRDILSRELTSVNTAEFRSRRDLAVVDSNRVIGVVLYMCSHKGCQLDARHQFVAVRRLQLRHCIAAVENLVSKATPEFRLTCYTLEVCLRRLLTSLMLLGGTPLAKKARSEPSQCCGIPQFACVSALRQVVNRS